jgi:hypothetical protein
MALVPFRFHLAYPQHLPHSLLSQNKAEEVDRWGRGFSSTIRGFFDMIILKFEIRSFKFEINFKITNE